MTETTEAAPAADGPYTAPPAPSLDDAEALVAFAKGIPKDGELVVDASGVTTMSSPFLFAMVSAARTFGDGGGKVAVLNPSAEFVDAFSDLGLFQDLMKMEFRQ